MTPNLEPTYLRYIYDGLVKGSIHPENAAELPEGLIGLYEEAFDERTSVVERQKLLQRFAIWALLKKEVSAAFVAEVLGETEDEIQDFISKYSAWFNSPESSKYQLYHERLKVYLLQKLCEGEVAKLNTLIVDYLVQKVNEAQQSESVTYCFENLSFHLFLNGYLTGESDLFAQYCLDDNFKKSQFEISGYYEWEEKVMTLGVEYFSLKHDPICRRIVFEKTKIQFKKKNIDLISSLIKSNELETVFKFFRKFNHEELESRIELFFYYTIAFIEIFENSDWTFIQSKKYATILLEIFESCFSWDNNAYWVSTFVDVNITFRLHCYFMQFGLDFIKIAKHSTADIIDYYDFDSYSELKFIGKEHDYEGSQILVQSNLYKYGFEDKSINSLQASDFDSNFSLKQSNILNDKIKLSSKIQLMQELNCIGYDCNSFNEIMFVVKVALNMVGAPKYLKQKILKDYKAILYALSNGEICIKGVIGTYEGNNTLEVSVTNQENLSIENKSLTELISSGLNLETYFEFEFKKCYLLLSDESLDSNEDIKLMLFFLELSEKYQTDNFIDIESLLSALLIEFHLNMNDELIDNYINQLIELIESQFQEASEDFESKLFLQIIDFLVRNEINGHRRKTAEKIKDLLLEKYFDFNLYKDSFISGCKLINLFSKLKIDFPEEEIVERILEDLNYLIEENDYNELQEIDCSFIDDIYRKEYFLEFYNNVKRIQIEEVRNNLSEYIFESILEVKGLNHKTVSFFKENSNEYPGMYLWAQNRISQKLLEQNEMLSYVTLKDNNDLLLERLLLNIVSKRENLKDELNLHILKHYGLDWVIELDNEYEKLISTN